MSLLLKSSGVLQGCQEFCCFLAFNGFLHVQGAGGEPLQGGAPFLFGVVGRSQREICAGCIVSCTTVTSCLRNLSRSTSLRSAALKAVGVMPAAYLRRRK